MQSLNPFGPITPQQEHDIRAKLAEKPHLLTRHARETVLRELRTYSAGHSAWLLEMLGCKERGEPRPPKPRLDAEPLPVESPEVARARHEAVKEELRAGFAGRAMQQHDIGLLKPSLFAGFNGNPKSTLR